MVQVQRHLQSTLGQDVTPLVYTKKPVEPTPLPAKIEGLEFGVQTPQEIVKCGEFHVFVPRLYKMPERIPHRDGPLDTRLGVSLKKIQCHTCGLPLADCAGHFGYIKLELPVFHIGYFKDILALLQCICKTCARVLLPHEARTKFVKRFRNPRLERTQADKLFKEVIAACKKSTICTHCGDYNGTVKKATNTLKIIHDCYTAKNSQGQMRRERIVEDLAFAIRHNPAINNHIDKLVDDLNPIRVLHLFTAIPDEDTQLLDLSTRPEHLIITHMAVPPVSIRPSVEMETGLGSNEDDATIRLTEIINVNNAIRTSMAAGAMIHNIMEQWDFLQAQCALYINSDAPGLGSMNPPAQGRPLRGFSQRLKGKQGRFRGNLSGKRVDFSGRTVISPDPNLGIHEVCVPMHMATVLTYPERVTPHNLDKLRSCVLNGPATHPGANFLEYQDSDGATKRRYLKFGDRRRIASELAIGNVVERHLMDGDIVLFNRQPSLHRISIMAHRARVRPWRTLRFNECVCSPYNADFDGDEMNMHVPQTEEARAEALELMHTENNLCTPKNGEIMICANQDFLTCAFLVTSKDVFLTRSDMCALAAYMGDATNQVDLPTPAILKPVELWTGKQMFSLLVRPNLKTRLFLNFECAEKIYTKQNEHMCPADGYVCFRNSELISGRVGKTTLGGNKSGLFGSLNGDYTSKTAGKVMNRLAKLSARHMGNRGFSIGIDDVTPALRLNQEKEAHIEADYAKCRGIIKEWKAGTLSLEPGCNIEQSMEAQVTGVLNGIREKAGKVCMDTLHWHNSPLIMSQCGSKGSPINIAQMVACVGQQSVGGKRCFNGFKDRTLPHFEIGDRSAQGKGFVANSFFTGLTPTEFFFHTMAGREGLVDTAVKTAETGYMSRRLMKCLEDLYTHYDTTVRNSSAGIVQFAYGDDGLDPVTMEGKDGKPLDLKRVLANCRHRWRRPTGEAFVRAVLLPEEMAAEVAREFEEGALSEKAGHVSGAFRVEVREFLTKIFHEGAVLRKSIGLDAHTRGEVQLEITAGQRMLTRDELSRFISDCVTKYETKRMDAGSTVGAFGAQSVGEPGTQMTLKTFHFAGVASMNVTLGVPRIKEIINAAKTITTPIMKVYLEVDSIKDATVARIIKGRIEKTTLGQVSRHIRIVFKNGDAYLAVRLHRDAIASLQLDIDAMSVARAILREAGTKLKLKDKNLQVVGASKVVIKPTADASKSDVSQDLLFSLQTLAAAIPHVIVAGIPSVSRAVINKEKGEDGKERHMLLVEGTNYQAVMGITGVRGAQTKTNHVFEVEKCLGIEAARKVIIDEITYTMGSHGMSIDARHMMLLADSMTYKGEVLGITRFGIAKMKDSVMNLASFEKTTDHLFAAAIHGRKDAITGVSESIIMGIPMPTGTGLFGLLHCNANVAMPPPRADPVLLSYSS